MSLSQVVPLTIRTLHVLAMVLAVGGTAAGWYGFRDEPIGDLALARRYEWVFWAALGVLVLTGVGNLGSLGVPGPATDWGRTLSVKLSLVVAVLCVSAVRTLSLVHAGERADVADGTDATDPADTSDPTDPTDAPAPPAALHRHLGRLYGVTSVLLVVIVALAEVLAHG